jgi:hypothetical protein
MQIEDNQKSMTDEKESVSDLIKNTARQGTCDNLPEVAAEDQNYYYYQEYCRLYYANIILSNKV